MAGARMTSRLPASVFRGACVRVRESCRCTRIRLASAQVRPSASPSEACVGEELQQLPTCACVVEEAAEDALLPASRPLSDASAASRRFPASRPGCRGACRDGPQNGRSGSARSERSGEWRGRVSSRSRVTRPRHGPSSGHAAPRLREHALEGERTNVAQAKMDRDGLRHAGWQCRNCDGTRSERGELPRRSVSAGCQRQRCCRELHGGC